MFIFSRQSSKTLAAVHTHTHTHTHDNSLKNNKLLLAAKVTAVLRTPCPKIIGDF